VQLYLHSPNSPLWRGAQLKHRDLKNFMLKITSEKMVQNLEVIPGNLHVFGIYTNRNMGRNR
jgi:hypothetical protein